jgi:hypothetical protein
MRCVSSRLSCAVIEIDIAPRVASQPVYQIPRLGGCLMQLRQLHPRLCPRQVLGLRMGLEAGLLLGREVPRTDKRLVALVETGGCFADGVSVATGCWLEVRPTSRSLHNSQSAELLVQVCPGTRPPRLRGVLHLFGRVPRSSADKPPLGTSRSRPNFWSDWPRGAATETPRRSPRFRPRP